MPMMPMDTGDRSHGCTAPVERSTVMPTLESANYTRWGLMRCPAKP